MKQPASIPAANPAASTAPAVYTAVVNLARATDRRAIMQAQFDRLGMNAEFIPAVDASDPEQAPLLDTMPPAGPWGRLGLHDKACTLSHIATLRHFLTRKEPFCLMLEDDVFLSAELPHWIADMSWWPADAELVKIERWRDDRLVLVLGKAERHHAGRRLTRLYSRHSGSAGYFVTRAAARRIVNHQPVNVPADHLLFNVNISPLARSLIRYQLAPALVVQGNEPKGKKGTRVRVPENKALRELIRAWHEIKVIPAHLWQLAIGRTRLAKVTWQDHSPTEAHT
ncbi:MAG: glycosyltransferase family 25 protein [Paracoccaceae bacterium]